MKVLISDIISNTCVKHLREHGLDAVYEPGVGHNQLARMIPVYHGLIVRSATKVSRDILIAGKNLRVVGRAGTGVDNIDVAIATDLGIAVLNAPGANAISAAEHTFALMISLARRIPAAHASISAGKWERSTFSGMELCGKNLGIVGLGRIGREVAVRAAAFGMQLTGYDPFLEASQFDELGVRQLGINGMLEQCDFITFHSPLNAETRHLISYPEFERANQNLHLINVARGGIVDETALIAALTQGKIAGAALDVFETEPPDVQRFAGLRNLIMTPHLGASTTDAQERVAVSIADGVVNYLLRQQATNLVNPTVLSPRIVTT